MYVIPNQAKRISETNITICFPEKTDRERTQLIHTSLIELGKTSLELGHFWCNPGQYSLNHVNAVSGKHDVVSALAQGHGVILASPHLGAWELAGLYCSHHFPLTTLYRPPRLEGLDAFIKQGRERCGATLVPANAKGVRKLYQQLKKGECIGILPDQQPKHGTGEFIPFFDVQAYTMTLLWKLAQKSSARVFLTYAERQTESDGYHIHFHPLDERILQNDGIAATSYLNAEIEKVIRRIPAQYQWRYKRFGIRPVKGYTGFY